MSNDHLPPLMVVKNVIPPMLGCMLDWFLCPLCVQVYRYSVTFPKDRLALKALIYFLFVVETSRTLLLSYYTLNQYGTNYGVYNQLPKLGMSSISVPIMGSLVSGTVQLFLTWRILTLGKSWIVAAPIAMIALAHSGAGISMGIYSIILDDAAKLRDGPIRTSGIVWIVSGTCADVIIALTTAFLLTRMRTGFRRTSMVLDRLILMSIETGTVTAIAELIILGLFFGFQSTSYFLVLSFCLSKLYSNNLVRHVLIQNSRETSRAELNASTYTSQPSAFVTARPPSTDSTKWTFNDSNHYRLNATRMSSSRKQAPADVYV
ncbi:hypothetical protein DL96DRAFT_1582406 [Flagelloscypha sp. PMI_526]|nr:hypothetical protein DL96DRAFT_1582406 [Flagelloscypha sp. PMI_526]